jgi:predicted porin
MFNLGEISMKKVLVAMAVLAATSAFAQSSVTLYGRLDLGMSSVKTTSNAVTVGPATSATTKKTSLAGNQHGRTTSRLGVRGTEDLGGGLVAGFNIETKVNPDNSLDADGFSTFGKTRLGNLFLNGGFGTVVIGTYLNGLDDVRGYSAATYSVPGGDFMANNAQALSGRSENSLGYRSPSFGGFHVRANIVNEKTASATTANKLSGVGFAAGYDNGPLSALFAIGNAKLSTSPVATTSDFKISDFGLAVSYNLGIAVPYVQFEQSKNTNLGNTPNTFTKKRAFEVGAKFPLGAFTPYVTLSTGKASTDAGSSGKSRGFQIGTTYDISKRTYVYAALGSDKVNSTNAPVGSTNSASKRTGYALGLVHSF